MTASRKTKDGKTGPGQRTPLTPDLLRKVVGGQSDDKRERPQPAVLIEQSIVLDQEAGGEVPPPVEAAFPPSETKPTEAVVPPEPALQEDDGPEEVAGSKDPAAQAPAALEAPRSLVADAPKLPATESQSPTKATVSPSVPSTVEGATSPITTVMAGADDTREEEETNSEGAVAETTKPPADDAAGEVAGFEARSADTEAMADADDPVEDAVASQAASLASKAIAAASATAASKLATAPPPPLETLVVLPYKPLPAKPTKAQLATATAVSARPVDHLQAAQPYDPSAAPGAVDAVRAADAKRIAAGKAHDDAYADWSRKLGSLPGGAQHKDVQVAQSKLLQARDELTKAAATFAQTVLPADYKPYVRVAEVNPFEIERAARNELHKALSSGNASDIAAAQKRFDAVKLPEGRDDRLKWLQGRHNAVERTTISLIAKLDAVEKRIEQLTASGQSTEQERQKNIVKQGDSLLRDSHLMRDLTWHAREHLNPQLVQYKELHQSFDNTKAALHMATAYKAALIKDRHAATLDLARMKGLLQAAQEMPAVAAPDAPAADRAVAETGRASEAAWDAVSKAVAKEQAATLATKQATAEAAQSLKTFNEKLEAYRKQDPHTDRAIKALEQAQKQAKEGGPSLKFENSLDSNTRMLTQETKRLGDTLKNRDASAKRLDEAYAKLWVHADWGSTIQNEVPHRDRKNHWSRGTFDEYSAAGKTAYTALKGHLEAQKDALTAFANVSKLLGWHADEVARYNEFGRKIDIARLGGVVGLKATELALKQARDQLFKEGFPRHELAVKMSATEKLRADAKMTLDMTTKTLERVEWRNGPAASIAFNKDRVNAAYATWLTADKAATKAKQEFNAFNDGPYKSAIAAVAAREAELAAAKALSAEAETRLKSNPALQKATTELEQAWRAKESAIEKTRGAMLAELRAGHAIADLASKAQAAVHKHEIAKDARLDLDIRQLKALKLLEADAMKAPDGVQLKTYDRAIALVKASLLSGVDYRPGAGEQTTTPAAEPAGKTTAPGKAGELVKPTADPAKVDAKTVLESVRGDARTTVSLKGNASGEIAKESGKAIKTKPWGTAYQQEIKAADKEGRRALDRSEVDAKTQVTALESLKAKVTTKSHELTTALGKDLAREIALKHAEASGSKVKVVDERVLAGGATRLVVLNGTATVDTVAQVSIKSQAEAYYSNLGAYGSAEFGLKTEVGAAGSVRTDMGKGVGSLGEGRAYAAGTVDVSATGGVDVLGLSADLAAKANARGEVSGVTGFAFGEHVKFTGGGQAGAEGNASASAGAKLGVDGGSVKLSASAEAQIRAGYVQHAKLGELHYTGNTEVYAKADARAAATASAGMVKGDFQLGAKLGASAGGGVGIQDSRKIKVLGIEFEGTLGVHAGTIGATAGVEVGFKNGTLKWSLDVGAALGVGINLKLSGSIDIVEAIRTAISALSSLLRAMQPGGGLLTQVAHNMDVDMLRLKANQGHKIFT